MNQYGSIPNKNRNTANPNSIRPAITLTAYQISPAWGDIKPYNGNLRSLSTLVIMMPGLRVTYMALALSPRLIIARAVKPGGPQATNAPLA